METQRANSQFTIVAIDDEPINLATLSEILANEGYRVIVTSRARKAIALIKNQLPDLILLDIYMPGLNGIEICRALRDDPVCREIPVIFLTASTSDNELGYGAGAKDYIVKPFAAEVLLSCVAKQLHSSR